MPLITAKNIKNISIDFSLSEEFIPENQYTKWMTFVGGAEKGDVVISDGSTLVGESAQVLDTRIALAQRIILLTQVNTMKITNDVPQVPLACSRFWCAVELSSVPSSATGSTALKEFKALPI